MGGVPAATAQVTDQAGERGLRALVNDAAIIVPGSVRAHQHPKPSLTAAAQVNSWSPSPRGQG